MTRAMTSEQALAIAASKVKAQGDGRPFRWTPRRDRELQQLRDDLFSFTDCAKILGSGCTPAQAKARMAELRKADAAIQCIVVPIPARADHEQAKVDEAVMRLLKELDAAGVRAEGDPLPPRPRPEKLQLPRYGEMEKRYDRFVRGELG